MLGALFPVTVLCLLRAARQYMSGIRLPIFEAVQLLQE